jgi:type VI protein secretion system component VasK
LNLTANQTYFQSSASQASGALENVPLIGKTIASMKKAEDKAKATAANLAQIPDSLNGPADITRSFQPVHWVEPPGSETWVGEKNAAYVEALAQLRRSMQEIADSGRDPAVHQAAAQNYEKALGAVHQIALGFKPVGVAGLDGTVQRLLEDPIRKANPFIIRDIEKVGLDKINNDLRAFCKSVQPTFRKYPIMTSSTDDALPEELTRAFGPGQGIWKFQQQSIAELVGKEGSEWKVKDPAKKPQVTAEMLRFLTSSQQILNAFYSSGTPQPQLTYTLRPKLDSNFKDSILELEIDGQLYQWTGPLQKAFAWPAPLGTKDLGAIARLRIGGTVAFPFASRPGVWGIFRILGDAEPREYGSKLVEWKYSSGGVGRREPISPAPVQLEIVTFPGGVDVFNPNFWKGLQCPTSAVQ